MDALEALKEVRRLELEEKESAQDFATRAYEDIKSAEEDDWNRLGDLSEEVQTWYNKYHQHVIGEIKGRLPMFPGVSGADRPGARKRERLADGAGKGGGVGSGFNTRIKELTLEDPKMSAQAIMEKMQSEGMHIEKISTVSTTRGAFVGAIKFLKTKGHLADLPEF